MECVNWIRIGNIKLNVRIIRLQNCSEGLLLGKDYKVLRTSQQKIIKTLIHSQTLCGNQLKKKNWINNIKTELSFYFY